MNDLSTSSHINYWEAWG